MLIGCVSSNEANWKSSNRKPTLFSEDFQRRSLAKPLRLYICSILLWAFPCYFITSPVAVGVPTTVVVCSLGIEQNR